MKQLLLALSLTFVGCCGPVSCGTTQAVSQGEEVIIPREMGRTSKALWAMAVELSEGDDEMTVEDLEIAETARIATMVSFGILSVDQLSPDQKLHAQFLINDIITRARLIRKNKEASSH